MSWLARYSPAAFILVIGLFVEWPRLAARLPE